jgi:hypothetical protein
MLLRDPTKVKLPDMQGVFRWRNQVLEGLDDITLNLNSSTLDLTDLGEISQQRLPRHPKSASGLKVAPKLKAMTVPGGGDAQGQYYSLDRQVLHTNVGSHRPSLPTNVYNRPQEIPPLDLSFVDFDSLASEPLVLPFDSGRRSSVERYVSLGYMDDSGLPSSRQNLDVFHALHPQSTVRTDSGFVNPRGEDVNKSTQSINLNGPRSTERHPVSMQHQSLPNIQTAVKHATPLTMETVVNSNLDPEEKLDLMSRICLGNVELTPELYYKIYPNPMVSLAPKPSNSRMTLDSTTLPRSHRVRGSGLGETQYDAQQRVAQATRPKSAVEASNGYHGAHPHHMINSRSMVNVPRLRPLSAADHRQNDNMMQYYPQEALSQPYPPQNTDTYQQPINRDSGFSEHSLLQRQSADFPDPITKSYNCHSSQNTPYHGFEPNQVVLNNQQPVSAGILRNKCSNSQEPQRTVGSSKGKSQAVPGRRKPSKRSSIKVEEWMQRPEHQLEMTRGHDTDRSEVKQKGHTSPR